jgi:hypothetical protein
MIAHWYNDGGTWRQTNAFWYKDGSTWREMAEVWYNDGGTWRRVHRRELRRPTAYSVSSGTFDIESNTGYAYDADDSTHRLTAGEWQNTGITGAPPTDVTGVADFTTWQTTSNTYNTLSLYMSAAVEITQNDAITPCRVVISFSTDGTNYSSLWTSGSGSTIVSVPTFQLSKSLSTSQNLSNLKISCSVIARGASTGTSGVAKLIIYDIFTVGTY